MAMSGWKLNRSRGGGGQLSLVICAVVAVFIVLLAKTEANLFDSARAKLSDYAAPVLEKARSPLAAVQGWVDSLGTVFAVYQENIRLRQENAELRKWQNAALSLENRLQRYELLVNAVPDPEIPSITVRVIGQSNRPFVQTMILNAGKDRGVRAGQAVVDARGLIGRVYLVGERTSWVISLTDLSSRVPVIIEPSNHRAILQGGNMTSSLQLDSGPADVKTGDRVLSSGDGGLLPPGLPVGTIVTEGDAFRVALYSDAQTADYVQVLDYQAPELPQQENTLEHLPAQGSQAEPKDKGGKNAAQAATASPAPPKITPPASVSPKPSPAKPAASTPTGVKTPAVTDANALLPASGDESVE
jgi:rod shape-determining protein MreC